jgi:dual specificity tyrosine-phosphorylation-regulated kinase 2/3/4
MASEEGPKPSPTETTETTSHGSSVCDDDDDDDGPEVIVLHDNKEAMDNGNQRRQQQTRFSFYDAQEVQSQFTSSLPQSSMDSSENKNSYRYNFYDPSSLPKNEDPIKVVDMASQAVSSSNALHASLGTAGMLSSSNYHLQSQQPLYDRENLVAVDNNLRRVPDRRHPMQQQSQQSQPLQDDHRTTSQNSLHSGSRHSHTEEILRSLQETEEQRMQILHPTTNLMDPPHVLANRAASSAESLKMMHDDAMFADSTAASTSNSNPPSVNTSSNPYEDAIREALDLLRKHRSPPPSPSVKLLTGNHHLGMDGVTNIPPQPAMASASATHTAQLSFLNTKEDFLSRTSAQAMNPSDQRSPDSLTDALQEAKLKAKQRQERMAQYANRLQEFKSSLPPEQQLHLSQSQEQSMPSPVQQIISSSQGHSSYALSNDNLASTGATSLQQPISIVNDGDSVGLISDISQSTRQGPYQTFHQPVQIHEAASSKQRIVDEEVQNGVEKVLMAILEASKSTSSQNSAYGGENANVDTASTQSVGTVSEVLLRAMDEVLYGRNATSDDRSSAVIGSGNVAEASAFSLGGGSVSKPSISGSSRMSFDSHRISKRSSAGAERSVVDELLAEADEESAAQYWEEKKMTESDMVPPTAVSPNLTRDRPSEKDIDALIEESLRGSNVEEEVDEVIEIQSDELEEDEDLQSDYDAYEHKDEDDDENDDDEVGSPNEGVLGPLSRKAGGTTGVVLDAQSPPSPIQPKSSQGYFSNVVKNVTSALTPDRQRAIDNQRSQRAIVNQRSELEPQKSEECDDASTLDVEAVELMRTLCAHLLPFGVDQASNLEEIIPPWDEDNPNEAGYRIIRLSKPQLRRVERAFDSMINGLKNKSHSQLNGPESEYDANFIRELQEAERVLEDEEKRNRGVLAVEGDVISTNDPTTRALGLHAESFIDDKQENKNELSPHPDFPGIKTAGKGEMGDLEFFHLPIIFKSHVTGFEPTKDMVLEPGNVVAGQYLVESELGSAAFSTAYRCIDLSSDDTHGHEEVCLKVIKNTKDFFDQSLDEIKILELLRQTGKCDENYIIRMKTFFYYREHLVIVTELLRQNLFEFGKFIIDNDEEPYFTILRLAFITRQCLIALRFVHSLGLVHSDIKPENILLGSYSRAKIKVIDFGSSCYLTDRQSSYIQSRSYRAPEVVLGLPYSGKIDVWSLGCVVAEMYTGEVTFQNDSIASMLSRIEAICGSFPRHMIAQGRQSGRFFTKSGLLYEVVDDSDNESGRNPPPGPNDDGSESEADNSIHFDIFQPKNTTLSSRLGFDADLMDDYENNTYSGSGRLSEHELQQIFTDFVSRLLTIDPDSRPTADEALQHPYMLYAATLTEEQIKYP